MADLIALIILVISLGVVLLILARKMPILAQLPEVHEGIQTENFLTAWKNKFKALSIDKIIALKFLSKTRIWVLKLEKYIDNLLQGIRKMLLQKKNIAIKKPPKIPPSA